MREILRVLREYKGSGIGNLILIGLTVLGAVKVDRLVGTNCGFVEEWIQDRRGIEKLKDNYPYL